MFCSSMTFTHWVSTLPARCRGGETVWLRCSASPCLGMTRCRALPAGFSIPPSVGFNCCFKVEYLVGLPILDMPVLPAIPLPESIQPYFLAISRHFKITAPDLAVIFQQAYGALPVNGAS